MIHESENIFCTPKDFYLINMINVINMCLYMGNRKTLKSNTNKFVKK